MVRRLRLRRPDAVWADRRAPAAPPPVSDGVVHRSVNDMKQGGNESDLPGVIARGEGDPVVAEASPRSSSERFCAASSDTSALREERSWRFSSQLRSGW